MGRVCTIASLSRCGSHGHHTIDKAILKHIILQFPFPVVLSDCTKPSVAPKPRFVCHASLKLPSPLMSAARGPKPSIAPKPKVPPELNGNEGGCTNGSLLTFDGEVAEEPEKENGLNNVLTAEEQFDTYTFSSPQKHLENVSRVSEDGEMTEEKEEDVTQKMDEDWRLTESAGTEEVDSLWVSDAGLTADSEEAVEMIDTDVTEDMDAEGCDAGEALADTDGLFMGDISVNGIDEEGGGYSAENQALKEKQVDLQSPEDATDDCTGDDLSESLTDEPGVPISENMKDTDEHVFLTNENAQKIESASDWTFTCNVLKSRCGHKINESGENLKYTRDPSKEHVIVEHGPTHETLYVSSEITVNKEMTSRSEKAHGLPQTAHRFLSVNGSGVAYDKIAENGQINCVSSGDYEKTGNREDHSSNSMMNHLDCQPRFRLVSISVPRDTDSSLTSSLSESHLLSPHDSDVFRDDDLEGHIVPFVDDSTDAEQDISDDHVYEEPGRSLSGETFSPFDRKVTGMQSRSQLHRMNNNTVPEMGGPFLQRPYLSGFGQPTLSSSPLLNSVRHKSTSKPHYLSLYPRSLSMEGQDLPLSVYRDREGSPMLSGGFGSSGSFSRCSPLPSSGLSTPTSVVDIPPPFELAYITKKPITKSSPSLLIEGDSSEKNRKKKSSIKRFLMLKFKRKTESKPVVDVSPSSFASSPESSHRTANRLLDLDRHSISSSPQLNSRSTSKPQISPESASTYLFYKEGKRKGSSVAFLNRSVVRVESFEDRSRVPFIPLPLTKPRSISFPNADTSDYENVPAINSDYENLQVPQQRPVRQVPFPNFFDRPSRVMSSANDTDGYVDMSSLPGFKSKIPEQETERYIKSLLYGLHSETVDQQQRQNHCPNILTVTVCRCKWHRLHVTLLAEHVSITHTKLKALLSLLFI